MIPTRQSLLSRLKDWGDNKSWKDFFDTYWKFIYRAGIKAGLTDVEAEDLVQETMFSVAKSMPGFKYRAEHASFKAWLMRLTRWRIADQFKKRPGGADRASGQEEGPPTEADEEMADPASVNLEATWNEDWELNLMEAALERVKKKVDPEMYQIFDCYVFQEWPASRVVRALHVNPARVYLAK